MEADDLALDVSLVFQSAQQLHPLLDVLGVNQTVFLQNLLHLRNAQDLLFEGGELRLRTIFLYRARWIFFECGCFGRGRECDTVGEIDHSPMNCSKYIIDRTPPTFSLRLNH